MRKTVRLIMARSSAGTEAGVVGLIVLVCLATASGGGPILNGDEARFAQASREMSVNHQWVVPTFGGQPRYDKPILIYWATIAGFRLFGVTPFSARLPSAAAGALCAALLGWSARRRWGPGSGLAAGLCLAASPIFFFEGQACTADALNMLWTLAAMLALEQILIVRPSGAAAAVLSVSLGAAVLTKGPVAPLFIVSTLICMWALNRQWKMLDSLTAIVVLVAGVKVVGPVVLAVPAFAAAISFLGRPDLRRRINVAQLLWGTLTFLVVTVPWAIMAWRSSDGEYFAVAVGRHVLERSQVALEGHSGFPGFYVVTAAVLCFPWLMLALHAGRLTWRQRRTEPGVLFLLAWAIGPLISLEMVQTQLVHYWLPSYPALILLAVGFVWNLDEREPDRHQPRWPLAVVHLVGGVCLAAIPVIPVVVFGLEDLLQPALFLSALLAVVCAISLTILARSPKTFLLVIPACVAIFLTLMFGPFLHRFSDSLIGTRTTRVALDFINRERTVALFGLRDEEMLFSLPVSTEICRSRETLHAATQRDRNTIFCAREQDFIHNLDAVERGRYLVVDTIEGLDLGRGRWVSSVFFRLARPAQRESRRNNKDQKTAGRLQQKREDH